MAKQKRIDGKEDTYFEVFYKRAGEQGVTRSGSFLLPAESADQAREMATAQLVDQGVKPFKITSVRVF